MYDVEFKIGGNFCTFKNRHLVPSICPKILFSTATITKHLVCKCFCFEM
ncbi:hypothetical protein JPSP40_14400 [Staphylococcus pseudintermedius]